MSTAAAEATKSPETKLTILQQLTAAVSAKATLISERDAALADVTTHLATIERLTAENTELQRCKSELDGTAATLLSERDAALVEVTDLKAKATTVAAGVVESVSVIGFPAEQLPKQRADGGVNDLQTAEDYSKAISAENDPAKKYALFQTYKKKFGPQAAASRN